MSFFVMMVILLWAFGWPILTWLYFEHKYTVTPPSSEQIDFSSRELLIGPRIVDGETVVLMRIGPTSYVIDDNEVTELIKGLRRTQTTVRTMNEVQELEQGGY